MPNAVPAAERLALTLRFLAADKLYIYFYNAFLRNKQYIFKRQQPLNSILISHTFIYISQSIFKVIYVGLHVS